MNDIHNGADLRDLLPLITNTLDFNINHITVVNGR